MERQLVIYNIVCAGSDRRLSETALYPLVVACTHMAPFCEGVCQGHGPAVVEGAAALVSVNVVRPAGPLHIARTKPRNTRRAWLLGSDLAGVGTAMITRKGRARALVRLSAARRPRH